MTSQYLLHITCVFVLNQELSHKILQGMPSAAASSSLTKGGCSAKRLRSTCLGQNSPSERKTKSECKVLSQHINPSNRIFNHFDRSNKNSILDP